MTYTLNIEVNPTYMHATITGTNSRDVVSQYLYELLQECVKRNCFRVLIEENLQGPRLDAMEVFAVVSEGSMKALGKFEALAYVDEKMGEMAEFAETIAINRGMPISVFDNVDDAKDWLSRQKPGASGQDIFYDRGKFD